MTRTCIFDDCSSIDARSRELARKEGRGCERCGTSSGITRRHRNTAYDYPAISKDPAAKEEDAADPNYATLCPLCWDEDDAYWKERWEEYYGSRL